MLLLLVAARGRKRIATCGTAAIKENGSRHLGGARTFPRPRNFSRAAVRFVAARANPHRSSTWPVAYSVAMCLHNGWASLRKEAVMFDLVTGQTRHIPNHSAVPLLISSLAE